VYQKHVLGVFSYPALTSKFVVTKQDEVETGLESA
jgi:hypothetical protein